MRHEHNNKLIAKALVIGALIALLSVLFHPEMDALSLTINGQPISEPIAQLAVLPTFLLIMGLVVILTTLLFMGVGILLFFGVSIIALMACIMLAPYLWPMLLIIFLVIAVMSFSHSKKT